MGHIDIKEKVEDKNSWFTLAKFSVAGQNFNRVEKTLDYKNLSKQDFDKIKVAKGKFNLFEASKIVRDPAIVKKLGETEDNTEVSNFFSKKRWLEENTLINFTFNFNPYQHIKKIDELDPFFKYYYEYSNLFLFVPNIKKSMISLASKKKETIIETDDYLKFVDESYGVLNSKNHKPIFVPVSLRLSLNDIAKLAEHYLKNEYYYFWFDFEGQSVNEASSARIKSFFDNVKKLEQYDKILCHFTNIKREILSNSKNDKSAASDALASIAGANIVGVDREPQRPIVNTMKRQETIEHKARIFDETTYYYVKTRRAELQNKNTNMLYNTAKLSNEIVDQTDYLLKNADLANYLESKKMLTEYKNGDILKALKSKDSSRQGTLEDWY